MKMTAQSPMGCVCLRWSASRGPPGLSRAPSSPGPQPLGLFPRSAASSQTCATSLRLWLAILTHTPQPPTPLRLRQSLPHRPTPPGQASLWPHARAPAARLSGLRTSLSPLGSYCSSSPTGSLSTPWFGPGEPPTPTLSGTFRSFSHSLTPAALAHTLPSLGLPSARSQLSAWGVHSSNSGLFPERTRTRTHTHTQSPWPLCPLHVPSLR